MAYTKKNPKLISGNLLHFGSLSGACELMIPCGWNQIKIHTNKTEKIVVNCGIDNNYSNTGGGIPPSEPITVPTYYDEIPNSVLVQLASATVVSVEVVENKGVVNQNYYSEINKRMYSNNIVIPIQGPVDFSCAKGEEATFTINNDFVEYQWQVSSDGGTTFTNTALPGNKTNELKFTVPTTGESYDGKKYRCRVINMLGVEQYSASATLTVTVEANNSKSNDTDTPTVEELEQDENVLKIDVPANEVKEIFEKEEKEGE